jgi:hypothetical protein
VVIQLFYNAAQISNGHNHHIQTNFGTTLKTYAHLSVGGIIMQQYKTLQCMSKSHVILQRVLSVTTEIVRAQVCLQQSCRVVFLVNRNVFGAHKVNNILDFGAMQVSRIMLPSLDDHKKFKRLRIGHPTAVLAHPTP